MEKYFFEIFLNESTTESIRDVFDAYIFLSYRKIDRESAQMLINLIHRIPSYERIAIWYDEFLTPGEDWSESIAQAMLKSTIVMLSITANILNNDNYVITHEFPFAQKHNIPILPVEVQEYDKEKLNIVLPNCPKVININDLDQLKIRLSELLKDVVRQEEQSPEHTFLLGLAYLNGIDVEIDRERAVELIKDAANKDLPEAMYEMARMYHRGKGVQRSFYNSDYWYNKLFEYKTKMIDKSYLDIELMEYYESYCELLDDFNQYFSYPGFVNNTMIPYIEDVYDIDTFFSLSEPSSEDIAFWYSIALFRQVHSEMLRDAGDFHAKENAEIINNLTSYITSEAKRRKVEKCYSYVLDATMFWEDFIEAIREKESKKTKKKKDKIRKIDVLKNFNDILVDFLYNGLYEEDSLLPQIIPKLLPFPYRLVKSKKAVKMVCLFILIAFHPWKEIENRISKLIEAYTEFPEPYSEGYILSSFKVFINYAIKIKKKSAIVNLINQQIDFCSFLASSGFICENDYYNEIYLVIGNVEYLLNSEEKENLKEKFELMKNIVSAVEKQK